MRTVAITSYHRPCYYAPYWQGSNVSAGDREQSLLWRQRLYRDPIQLQVNFYMLSRWLRIRSFVRNVARELWLYAILLVAVVALFLLAFSLNNANVWVTIGMIMAAGVVFGCLVLLFRMARGKQP